MWHRSIPLVAMIDQFVSIEHNIDSVPYCHIGFQVNESNVPHSQWGKNCNYSDPKVTMDPLIAFMNLVFTLRLYMADKSHRQV